MILRMISSSGLSPSERAFRATFLRGKQLIEAKVVLVSYDLKIKEYSGGEYEEPSTKVLHVDVDYLVTHAKSSLQNVDLLDSELLLIEKELKSWVSDNCESNSNY